METQTRKFGISAFALRTIAIVCMLLDHIGLCLPKMPLSPYFRIIGRPAFPIFVFLIVNGYRHTRSKPKYALRLGIFAVLSQIPFNLMLHASKASAANAVQAMLRPLSGGEFSFNALKFLVGGMPAVNGEYITGNVFFTLLFSLLCLWFAAELWKKGKAWRVVAFVPAVLLCILYHFGYLHTDYGMKGILLALVFYFFDGKKILTAIGSFAALFAPTIISYGFQLLNMLRGRAYAFNLPDDWTMKEAFALLALIPIFLYCGKKGYSPKSKAGAKALQIGFYLFYPVHMLVLWFLFVK